MRRIWRDAALAVILAWVIPWTLVCLSLAAARRDENNRTPPLSTTTPAEAAEPAASAAVEVLTDEGVVTMELEAYLVGVLLGEIPGSFHAEAKKAQAVVARTYTLRTVATKDRHPGMVCTDSACCQSYTDPEAYLRNGGTPETVEAAKAAVEGTAGQVLLYHGSLIDATYFSCSGGHTEDAVAVWGADVPYLQGVESPGEENAAHYTDTVRFRAEEFAEALGRTLPGSPDSWLGTVSYTEGGGVASMEIGGRSYKGTELRSLLGLRSTAFTMVADGDWISVTTKGFGHRVGMSQYGAQAMALDGSTYAEILDHYYWGTVLAGI